MKSKQKDKLKNQRKLTAGLGILSLASILFSHLALTDIYHAAEPDLTAEWWVVRVSAILILAFIAAVFWLLAVLKNSPTPAVD